MKISLRYQAMLKLLFLTLIISHLLFLVDCKGGGGGSRGGGGGGRGGSRGRGGGVPGGGGAVAGSGGHRNNSIVVNCPTWSTYLICNLSHLCCNMLVSMDL